MTAKQDLDRALDNLLRAERRVSVKRIQADLNEKSRNCPPDKLTDPVDISWFDLLHAFDKEWNR